MAETKNIKLYTIYKATNKINGKSYIGFTTEWPNRKKRHLNSAKRRSNYYFHRAIRKYGFDNFDWKVLYETKDADFGKNIMEPFLIKEHNTHYMMGIGYNMTLGGEGILGPKSETHKINLSKSHTGKKLSKEHKNSISKSLEGNVRGRSKKGKTYEEIYGIDVAEKLRKDRSKFMKGRPKTEESKIKSALTQTGRKRGPFTEEHKKNLSIAAKKRYSS